MVFFSTLPTTVDMEINERGKKDTLLLSGEYNIAQNLNEKGEKAFFICIHIYILLTCEWITIF